MFGFINVNKPSGMTSHDVISFLRRNLKIKKIGHTGTLDPMANGVLPIAVGDATRLIQYLSDDKEYVATVKFGVSTDTYDKEGEIVSTSDKIVEQAELDDALNQFRGEILQKPPIYSALKKNGKKLYEYAREGKEVEIEARKVTIEKLDLLSLENNVAKLRVKCSKGTYIRSIAHDLGEVLGCGAHLIGLTRTIAGDFKIENSIELSTIENSENKENFIENPLNYFSNLEKVELNENEYLKVSHGMNFASNKFTNFNNQLIILLYCTKIVAVTRIINNKTSLEKVFVK